MDIFICTILAHSYIDIHVNLLHIQRLRFFILAQLIHV